MCRNFQKNFERDLPTQANRRMKPTGTVRATHVIPRSRPFREIYPGIRNLNPCLRLGADEGPALLRPRRSFSPPLPRCLAIHRRLPRLLPQPAALPSSETPLTARKVEHRAPRSEHTACFSNIFGTEARYALRAAPPPPPPLEAATLGSCAHARPRCSAFAGPGTTSLHCTSRC